MSLEEHACEGCGALPATKHTDDCPVYAAQVRRQAEADGAEYRRMENLGLAYEQIVNDAVGRDVEGTADTPDRAARAWCELTRGYREEPPKLTTFEARHDEVVVVAPIPFFSLCEHHLLPFHGRAYIAYLPAGRVLGLSKFARVVHHYARRLQVQERLTTQIADHLEQGLAGDYDCTNCGHGPEYHPSGGRCEHGECIQNQGALPGCRRYYPPGPKGIGVVLKAEHLCMSMRGAQVPGAITTTSVMRGAFRDQPETRAEVLGLMGVNGK